MIFSEKSETPNLTDYLKAKPDSVVYYGDKKSTASWQLLYFIALKLIAAKHPDELMRLEGKSILGDKIEIGSEIEIREFSHHSALCGSRMENGFLLKQTSMCNKFCSA